jgi:hypothetical protein
MAEAKVKFKTKLTSIIRKKKNVIDLSYALNRMFPWTIIFHVFQLRNFLRTNCKVAEINESIIELELQLLQKYQIFCY